MRIPRVANIIRKLLLLRIDIPFLSNVYVVVDADFKADNLSTLGNIKTW